MSFALWGKEDGHTQQLYFEGADIGLTGRLFEYFTLTKSIDPYCLYHAFQTSEVWTEFDYMLTYRSVDLLWPFVYFFWYTKQIHFCVRAIHDCNQFQGNRHERIECITRWILKLTGENRLWDDMDSSDICNVLERDLKETIGGAPNVKEVSFQMFDDSFGNRRALFYAGIQPGNPAHLLVNIVFTEKNCWQVIWKMWYATTSNGTRCHAGLAELYDKLKVDLDNAILEACRKANNPTRVIVRVTGHYLGGALAALYGFEKRAYTMKVSTTHCPAMFCPLDSLRLHPNATIVHENPGSELFFNHIKGVWAPNQRSVTKVALKATLLVVFVGGFASFFFR